MVSIRVHSWFKNPRSSARFLQIAVQRTRRAAEEEISSLLSGEYGPRISRMTRIEEWMSMPSSQSVSSVKSVVEDSSRGCVESLPENKVHAFFFAALRVLCTAIWKNSAWLRGFLNHEWTRINANGNGLFYSRSLASIRGCLCALFRAFRGPPFGCGSAALRPLRLN